MLINIMATKCLPLFFHINTLFTFSYKLKLAQVIRTMWSDTQLNASASSAAADVTPNGTLEFPRTTIMPAGVANSDASTPEEDAPSVASRSAAGMVVWSIVLSIIIVIAVLGNLLVIVCVRHTARLRAEKSNMFLVNLSITDVGSACVVMTSSLHAMAADRWHLGAFWCDLVCGANYAFIIVSMLTLCFISLDRYAAVVYALRYHTWVTRRKIRVLIGWAWFQGICFGLAPVLAHWVRYDYWEVVCAIVWHKDSSNTLTYVSVAFVLCFLLPGLVLAVAYCKIIKVAKAQNNIHPHDTNLKPRLGVIRSDIMTSAGDTADRPGISIISEDQALVSSQHKNGQAKVSIQDRHAVCSKNTTFEPFPRRGSSPKLCTSALQNDSQDSRQEASDFDPPCPKMLTSEGLNGFLTSKDHMQWTPEQYKDTACNGSSRIEENNGYRASLDNIKAGYPGKPVDQQKRPAFRVFKLRSFSAPISPNCIGETEHGDNVLEQQEHIFAVGSQPTEAKQAHRACGKSLSLPTAISSDQSVSTHYATYRYGFEPNTAQTSIYLETTVSNTASLSDQSCDSFKGCGRFEAWKEDDDQCLDTQVVSMHAPDNTEGSTGTSMSPTTFISPSVDSVASSRKQKAISPILRLGSESSCHFSAIPGSPQSATGLPANGNASSQDQSTTAAETNGLKRQRNYSTSSKAVKSLLIVVLAFFICMTPFSITKLYKVLFPKPDSLPGYVNLVATIFQYCSSVINPLIYGIFRRDFQRAFLLIFKRALVKLRLRDSLDGNTDTFLASH
ncbi:hypothetical protein EGW08_009063 [Elysia chlorotica]|uniref:G-protein coupled receptors family 1 profile domain-containing protein n=1 Tax=Elysia chlorotica TaxID=188477 RepID=A0A433TNL0_ELYCH|nr:hypothetical protein EGW08_009063 [Elysia chlorotica]